MKKIVIILFLLSGITITANAQIDRHLKKEARTIIDQSHGAYYYSNSSHFGVTPTSLPTRHYRLSLSESDVRYTFQNGLPIHYQTLSEKTYNGAHYWSYAECINYDTCNRWSNRRVHDYL